MAWSSIPPEEQQERRRQGAERAANRAVGAARGDERNLTRVRVDCAECRGDRRKMGYVEYDATDPERWSLTVSHRRLGSRNTFEEGGTSRSETVLASVAHGRRSLHNGGRYGDPGDDPWEPDPEERFTWPCPRGGHRYDVTYAAIEAAVKRAISNRQTSMILPSRRRAAHV